MLSRAELLTSIGLPEQCRNCQQEIWWDNMMWRSMEGFCSGRVATVMHAPVLPDLTNEQEVEAWLRRV